MNETPFLTKLSDITKIPPGQLGDSLGIDPPTWDSIDVLDIIAAIDESYGTTIPVQSLLACRTVGELRSQIRSAAK